MYIAINNRYSINRWKITVILHRAMEAASSASAEPLNRDHIRGNPFCFLIVEYAHWSTARCPNSYRLDFW